LGTQTQTWIERRAYAKANSYRNGRSYDALGRLAGVQGGCSNSYRDRYSQGGTKLLARSKSRLSRFRTALSSGLYVDLRRRPMLVPPLQVDVEERLKV
jgi:hypothetical protein